MCSLKQSRRTIGIQESKEKLDPNKEVFIGVAWKKYVTDINDGYWEKGMTTVPLVAYMLNDKTTHRKVRETISDTPTAPIKLFNDSHTF